MNLSNNFVFKTLLMVRKNLQSVVFYQKCGILPLSSALFYKVSTHLCFHAANLSSQNFSIMDTEHICESLSFENLTPDLATIVDSDVVVKEKVRTIFSEYNFHKKRVNNICVPNELKSKHIIELLNLDTRSSRLKYFEYLLKKERFKLSKIAKRERKVQERKDNSAIKVKVDENDHINYGLGRNTLLLSIRDKSMRKFYNKRLVNASLFGPKIIIDLDYDEHMKKKEKRNCASQLAMLFGVNRINPYPFDLYFCNANFSSDSVKYLIDSIPNCQSSKSLVELTEKSYLDIFPKEKLVYLSPHADTALKQFNHNDIYIIGGFVDLVKTDHVSIEKAGQEGIRSYSLPIDEYIWWGSGSRSLSINQVFEIMLKLKNTGDWKQALEVVPKRKIRKVDPSDLEQPDLLPEKMYLVDTPKKKADPNSS